MEYRAIIYKITNLVNGKIYIGRYRRKLDTFHKYWGGGDLIKAAIKKYGLENFKKEIIVEGSFNNNLVNDLEKHYIRLYNSNNLNVGYNITIGGEGIVGNILSEDTKKKMSESHKNRKKTPEHQAKITAALTGRKRNPETIEKIRQSRLGKKTSPENAERLRTMNIGRKLTPEHIEKVRQWHTGKKRAKEAGEKISLHKYKKIYQFTLEGNLVKVWNSGLEIKEQTNYSNTTISNCATGSCIQVYGQFWVFNPEDISDKIKKYKASSTSQIKAMNYLKNNNDNDCKL